MANTQIQCYSLARANNNTGSFSPNTPDMHLLQTTTANATNASFTSNATDFFPALYRTYALTGPPSGVGVAPLSSQPSNWWYYSFPPIKETQLPTLPAYTTYPRIP